MRKRPKGRGGGDGGLANLDRDLPRNQCVISCGHQGGNEERKGGEEWGGGVMVIVVIAGWGN